MSIKNLQHRSVEILTLSLPKGIETRLSSGQDIDRKDAEIKKTAAE